MPKVPDYSNIKKPLKVIYNPIDRNLPATLKQKDYILTLYQRRKLPIPDVSKMTKGEASEFISRLVQ